MKNVRVFILLGMAALLLTACPSTKIDPDAKLPLQGDAVTFSSADSEFTLQVLHAADQEASPDILENARYFSAIVTGLKTTYDNTLVLGSGDLIIPGAFYFATNGIADMNIANAIGFQAFALGNHEFDLGTRVLGGLIESDDDYTGTQFPYLSSNLDFSQSNLNSVAVAGGASPQPNTIAPSVVIEVGGEKIGIVGATTPQLPSISSPGDVIVQPSQSDDIDGLATIVQAEIDRLTATGINKIVVLAHLQQISNEIALAGKLKDIDILMAGGSDTLLANSDDEIRTEYSKERSGVYPLMYNNADGQPVALINTDREYRYVGRLVANFDASGVLTGISDDSGAYASTEATANSISGSVENADVVAHLNEVREILVAKDGVLYGSSDVFLNGERGAVRRQETNLGNLSADANLVAARLGDTTVRVSIKNGGGIRASIGDVLPGDSGTLVPPQENPLIDNDQDGDISQLDIQNSLRFNNELVLLDVTAQELKDILEHGVSRWDGLVTAGSFPQVGGLSFSFDPEQQAIAFTSTDGVVTKTTDGQRIRSLSVDANGDQTVDIVVQNGEIVGDATRTFRIVTLSYLAGIRDNGLGGDGYPFPDNDRIDVPKPQNASLCDDASTRYCEQQAFADYLATAYPRVLPFDQADTDYEDDTRIQNLNFRDDTVLPSTPN